MRLLNAREMELAASAGRRVREAMMSSMSRGRGIEEVRNTATCVNGKEDEVDSAMTCECCEKSKRRPKSNKMRLPWPKVESRAGEAVKPSNSKNFYPRTSSCSKSSRGNSNDLAIVNVCV